MKTIILKNGVTIPKLGMGTWFMGDSAATKKSEINALRCGIELGMTLIDTAEMYGSGRSEQLVGEAISPYNRESLFIVSKVLPNNAGRRDIFSSCEKSLSRLKTDYLDCYLLHWRGMVSLDETVECMMELIERGRIKSFGVSNFDIEDMKELYTVNDGNKCTMNQVLYHLGSRGTEYSLLPWLKENKTAMMAYCPLAQGGSLKARLLTSEAVRVVAKQKEADPFQILLAFAIHDNNIVAIPKASTAEHVYSNYKAMSIKLTQRDIDLLSEDFPAPAKKLPLDTQ